MDTRLQRLLVLVGAVVAVLLAVLVVILVVDDGTEVAATTSTTLVTTTTVAEPVTITTIATTTVPDSVAPTESSSTTTAAEEPESEPEPEGGEPEPSGAAEPREMWRDTFLLQQPDGWTAAILPPRIDLWVTEAGFLVEVGSPIRTADLWLVSPTQPGPLGCRDHIRASGDPATQPIPLEVLDITDGWYACVDVDGFSKVAQIRLLDVVPGGWVQFEIVVWDLAG